MKFECIKVMDFKTRWLLRSSSKTEKALIDSSRLLRKMSQLKWTWLHGSEFSFTTKGETDEKEISGEHVAEKLTSFITHVISRYGVKTFNIFDPVSLTAACQRLDELIEPESLRMNDLNFDNLSSVEDFSAAKVLLKKSWRNMHDIRFAFADGLSEHSFHPEEIFSIPSVINVRRELAFDGLKSDMILPVMEKWSSTVTRVCAMLNITTTNTGEGIVEQLYEMFEHRKVSFINSVLRISSASPDKHIALISIVDEDRNGLFYGIVIPADLDEADYEKFLELTDEFFMQIEV